MKKFRQILEGTISSNEKTEIVRTESDAAYAASLKKIAMDKQIDSLSNRDRDTLARIADMMKNANDDRKEDVSEDEDTIKVVNKLQRKTHYITKDKLPEYEKKGWKKVEKGFLTKKTNKHDDEYERSLKGKAPYREDKEETVAETTLAQQQRDKTKSQHDAHAKRMNKSARDSITKYDQVKKDREAAAKRAGVGRSGETARQRANRLGHTQSEELMAFIKNANEAGVEPTDLMDAVENWILINEKDVSAKIPFDGQFDASLQGDLEDKFGISVDDYDEDEGKVSVTGSKAQIRKWLSDKSDIGFGYDDGQADKVLKDAGVDKDDDTPLDDLDDIKKKYAKEIIRFQDGDGELSQAALDALYAYQGSDAIKTDDPDELDDFVLGLRMGKYKRESYINEAYSKAFSKGELAKLRKKYSFIDDDEAEDYMSKFSPLKIGNRKGWTAISYPVRDGDYYFALIPNNNANEKAVRDANDAINTELKRLVGTGNFKGNPDGLYTSLTQWVYNNINHQFGYGDTMTREEIYSACKHILGGKYEEVEVNEIVDVSDLRIGKRKKAPKTRFKKGGSLGEVNEAIDSNDYKLDSEKSQFNNGHRGKVVHKEKGSVMYLGSMSWKTPDAAKGHANAYLMGYERGGETGARKAQDRYVDQNKNKKLYSKKESFKSYSEGAKEDALRAIKNDRDFKQVKDVDIRATTADMKLAKKNPIQQLRKISDQGRGQMEFLNNKKLRISKKEADALLRGFDSMKKPQDKEKYQTMISKDSAGLKRILKIVNK